MNKYQVTYQEVSEATIILEARDEDDLETIIGAGNYDLEWRLVAFNTDFEVIECGDEEL